MVLEFLKGKYGFQLFAFLLLALICFALFQVIGISILLSSTSVSIDELVNASKASFWMGNPEGYKVLFILLSSQSIGLFILPGIIFPWLIGNPIKNYTSFNLAPKALFLFLLPLLVSAGIVIVSYLGELNMKLTLPEIFHEMERSATETVQYLLSFRDSNSIITTLILMAVIPAIGEELFFRGVIQQIFVKWTKRNWAGILITAFIFSAIHFQFLTFLPRFFMGILLGYLFIWSKNLLLPILAHFLHNSVSIFIGLSAAPEDINKPDSLNFYLVLGALAVLSLVCYRFYLFSIKSSHVS